MKVTAIWYLNTLTDAIFACYSNPRRQEFI